MFHLFDAIVQVRQLTFLIQTGAATKRSRAGCGQLEITWWPQWLSTTPRREWISMAYLVIPKVAAPASPVPAGGCLPGSDRGEHEWEGTAPTNAVRGPGRGDAYQHHQHGGKS